MGIGKYKIGEKRTFLVKIKYLCKCHLILLSKKCLEFGDFRDGFVVFTTRKIPAGIRVFTFGFRAGRVLVKV